MTQTGNSLGGLIIAGYAGWLLYADGFLQTEPFFLLTIGFAMTLYAKNSRQQAGFVGKFAVFFFLISYVFGISSFGDFSTLFK